MLHSYGRADTPRAVRSSAAGVNILEELLLALMGHTGDVFVDTSDVKKASMADRSGSSFRTSLDLDFITAPQRCPISNPLAEVMSIYKKYSS